MLIKHSAPASSFLNVVYLIRRNRECYCTFAPQGFARCPTRGKLKWRCPNMLPRDRTNADLQRGERNGNNSVRIPAFAQHDDVGSALLLMLHSSTARDTPTIPPGTLRHQPSLPNTTHPTDHQFLGAPPLPRTRPFPPATSLLRMRQA